MSQQEDTQTRLLEAAGQVFADKGFKSTTVREICERAGSKNIAAVNYYFRDKGQLYAAALRYAIGCRIIRPQVNESFLKAPPETKLRMIIQHICQSLIDNRDLPWQMQLLMREFSNPSSIGIELVREFVRPVYELLWNVLRELLPAQVSEAKMHLIGFSIIGQCFYHHVGRAVIGQLVGAQEVQTYDADTLAEHICAFSLAAVREVRMEGRGSKIEDRESRIIE